VRQVNVVWLPPDGDGLRGCLRFRLPGRRAAHLRKSWSFVAGGLSSWPSSPGTAG
jgi:hypothetical protein